MTVGRTRSRDGTLVAFRSHHQKAGRETDTRVRGRTGNTECAHLAFHRNQRRSHFRCRVAPARNRTTALGARARKRRLPPREIRFRSGYRRYPGAGARETRWTTLVATVCRSDQRFPLSQRRFRKTGTAPWRRTRRRRLTRRRSRRSPGGELRQRGRPPCRTTSPVDSGATATPAATNALLTRSLCCVAARTAMGARFLWLLSATF